jgi:hypothetical protein
LRGSDAPQFNTTLNINAEGVSRIADDPDRAREFTRQLNEHLVGFVQDHQRPGGLLEGTGRNVGRA